MPRDLRFLLAGQALGAGLGTKVDKRALYGYARRVVEKDGKPLNRCWLLADGAILPRGAIGSLRVDPLGSPEGAPEARLDGQPAPMRPSSFDEARELVPVPLSELSTFATRDVYPLEGLSVADGLYRTEFNYRAAPQASEALVLVRGGEAFLLVGSQRQATFLAQVATYEFFDAETDEEGGDDEDELDFSML